ncbi:amino acid adenylation domain-containing protein [Micromonospora sp. CPCC 206060]|uniref:amino acid adenylation domain-containing protein n=1 Tax=Micromonospora sp. CPCC 206060 TaxID=3122406 RepID=UPI002FF42709
MAQATQRPGAVAVRQWESTLTYATLVGAAAALAGRLRALGVGPETRVGICTRRGPLLPVGVLGILASGGAYVVLDPAHPLSRLDDICADAGIDVVVVDEGGATLLADTGRQLVVPTLAPTGADAPPTGTRPAPAGAASATNTAYVLYTSGSTGRPKGVAVSQHSVASFVTAAGRHFGLDATCRAVAFSALGFDVSVLDLLTPLTCGASVQLVPDADRVDPARLQRFLAAHEVTWGFIPPALLPLLDPTRLPTLRDVVTAGEPPGPEQVARWSAPPQRRLHNWYGPTETTVCVVGGELTGDWQRPVPIGRPLAGCRAYVLDERMDPCPPGVPGELYIGGPQVALGYWRRPALTAERFVPDPYGDEPGARLYRTGDRAAWEPDGRIAYLGRLDRQVKIQGQRVEIGEVESVVRAHSRVSQAVVDVEPGATGELVAFLTPADAPDLAALREHCAQRLPGYMLPTRVVRLATLPLTVAGKTDLAALRELNRQRPSVVPAPQPAASLAAAVATAWAEVLQASGPAPTDGFLDVGGHSLRAMRLVSALRDRIGRDIVVEDVYAGRTLAGLTRRVEAAPVLDGADLVPVGNPPALSTAQRRMWFVEQAAPGTPTHTIAFAERLRGPLDLSALRSALTGVAERHQPLRWRVPQRSGAPYVAVDDAVAVPVPVLDLSDGAPHERERALRAALDAAALTPFDLATGPLWRVMLVRLADDEHVLAVTVHHLVFDGWSQEVFYRDLAHGYAAALDGRRPEAPPLRAGFADYVATLADRAARHGGAHLNWWARRLADAPTVCDLPRDRPRPATQSFRGATRDTRLDADTTAAVRALARRADTTGHTVLLAAFAQLVRRLTGQDDLIVGIPFADRDHVAFEPLIGLLLQILPLRLRIADDDSFTAHVRRCAEEVRLAVAHRDAPLERVVEALRVPRDLGRNPLIQVLFNMYTFGPARLDLPGCTAQPVPAGLPGSLFDLTLYVSEHGDGLHLAAVYNPDLYDADRIGALLDTYTHLVRTLVATPDAPVVDAPARPPAAGLPDWRTPLPRRDGVPVLHRIAGRVAAHPDDPAVTGAGGELTWRAFDVLRRRVAAAVGAAGIGPGETVAVLASRHVALPALLLGVLTAGARWAVLDTAHPAARLARQATAAAAKALLVCPDVTVPAELDHLIRLDPADPPAPPDGTVAPVDGTVAPDGGYLSFTSGTTGEPQVVAGTAAALAAFLDWYPDTVGLGPHDRFALLAGLGHDPVLRDLYTPLVLGARLAVPDQALLRDPVRLGAWLREQRITVAHLTPQLGRMLTIGPAGAPLSDLRLLVVAGDQFTAGDSARLRALAPHARLVNAYGTTETPQIHSWYEVPADPPGDVVPIGHGAPGSALVVVDRSGRPAAVGELGEVVVRSRHLATGYLDPGLTDRRFDRTPGGTDPQDRRYRTGDLGRHRPDGTVVLAGRVDHQIKVRGYRVELAEIEAALAAHPDVRAAAALPVTTGAEQGIRAFVAPAQPDLRPADLVEHLRARFPEYAVPAQLHLVPAIPLTANGKVDRRALAGIVPRPQTRPVDDELRTRTERLVAGIWCTVLGRQRVGPEDNFFDTGGHSLALVAVAARLSAAVGAEIPVVELFRRPTVRLLAGFLDGDSGSSGLDRAARRVAARRERLRQRNQGRAGGATDTTGEGAI